MRIGIGNRERNALTVLVQAHNDELSRLLLACDTRGFNDELFHATAELAGFQDAEHGTSGEDASTANVLQS